MQAGKIAVDAHVLEGKPQGTQTSQLNLLREIGKAGRAGDFALYCSDIALCRRRLGDFPFTYIKASQSGPFARLLLTLPFALAKNRARTALWQYVASPLFFGSNVVVIHDVLPYTHPSLFPPLFRLRCQILFFLSMLFASRIVTVSEFSRRELCRLFPYFTHKVAVVHNGPSFPSNAYFEPPTGTDRPKPYILAVGRIERRKNMRLLTQSFLAAQLPDTDLVIVGKADRGYATQFPSDTRIDIRSDVGDGELIELYKGASLFVFPSMAEGFGLPVLDAIAFGVPCICSNQTAMPSVAAGMVQFFDPTTADAEDTLAQLIAGHFSNSPITPPSDEQRHAVLKRFSWRSSAATLLSILDDMAIAK